MVALIGRVDGGPARRFWQIFLAALGTSAVLAAVFWSAGGVARADTVVSGGSCNRDGIQAALNLGGVVTFHCGTVSILITPTLIVSTTVTLDGGNNVTLDGGGLSRIISTTTGSALTLTNVSLRNGNAADGQGGGAVYGADLASLKTANAVFSNNDASALPIGSGGAILVGPGTILEIADSTFISNSADLGGAIIGFDVTLSNSSIVSNTASDSGGGLYAGTIRVTNSTIAGNSAAVVAGAIWFGASLEMTNTTVMHNGANGITGTVNTLPFTLTNSIVGGEGLPLCGITAAGVLTNFVQDNSCVTGGTVLVGDPQLGPVQDNGGSTLTMAPQPGSGVIDKASFCLPTDQRGVPRSTPCDLGAFESGAAPAISSLNPASTVALSPTFTLTVTGSGFITGTVGRWNGSPRTTTVLSSTALQMIIPSGDITTSGSATVTVAYGLDAVSNGLPFTITKRDQTIAFGALPGKTFGDPPFTVTATASSGLTVTFGGTGNCTISVVTVTITGAGSCTITGTQSGDMSYAAADPVTRSFAIAKASQTITFPVLADKTVGDAPFVVTATASSGLTVTFGASGSCNVGGSTVTVTVSGTCTITATQTGGANYLAATPVSRAFNVAKLGQTISFDLLPDRFFGDIPFVVSATASSGLTVTFGAAGSCTVAGSTVSLTGGGTCTITASQPGDVSFLAATPVSRTFSIGKSSQTITFAPLPDRTLGDPAFTVTAMASSGLPVEFSATGSCSISGLTVTLNAAGPCTISASQPGNATYSVAPPVQRSFMIGGGNRVVLLPGVQVSRQQ